MHTLRYTGKQPHTHTYAYTWKCKHTHLEQMVSQLTRHTRKHTLELLNIYRKQVHIAGKHRQTRRNKPIYIYLEQLVSQLTRHPRNHLILSDSLLTLLQSKVQKCAHGIL